MPLSKEKINSFSSCSNVLSYAKVYYHRIFSTASNSTPPQLATLQYFSPIAGTDLDLSSGSNSAAVVESTDLPSLRTTMKISPAVAPELAMNRRPLESKATPVGRMQPGQSAALILSVRPATGLVGRLADERIGMTAVLLVLGDTGRPFSKVMAKSLYPSGGLRFLFQG
jgi:hypothetical protein